MREPTKLLDGGTFFEAPRWHQGRWWVSDFYTGGGRIVAVDPEGAIPGTKAGESIALGSLVVSVAPVVLPKLLETVTHWLRRQPAQAERLILKTADAEIDIPRDVTPEQLREYVDALSDRSD